MKRSLIGVEERPCCYNKTKSPFHFGASKSTLTGVEEDAVGCGDDCLAFAPSEIASEGDVVNDRDALITPAQNQS